MTNNVADAAPNTRDYLVVCSLGTAQGSWARGDDLEKTITRCKRIVYSDWRCLFKLDGVEVTLSIFDVTGQDSIEIGPSGIEGDHPEIPIIKLEPRKVRLPGRRTR